MYWTFKIIMSNTKKRLQIPKKNAVEGIKIHKKETEIIDFGESTISESHVTHTCVRARLGRLCKRLVTTYVIEIESRIGNSELISVYQK